MYIFERLIREMGIDLRGGNIGMPQHFLNGAEVCPVHQEIGGEAVPEFVRMNVFADSRAFGAGV